MSLDTSQRSHACLTNVSYRVHAHFIDLAHGRDGPWGRHKPIVEPVVEPHVEPDIGPAQVPAPVPQVPAPPVPAHPVLPANPQDALVPAAANLPIEINQLPLENIAALYGAMFDFWMLILEYVPLLSL